MCIRDRSWHVRAEALRYVRAENVPADRTEEIVDWLTGHVLDRYSIPLSPASDGVDEPEPLRRLDGTSVYTVAGNRLYTSTRILAAEQRILTNAGRHDGRTVPDTTVDLALLETAANGVQLNAGQVALVQAMASSAARVQLAKMCIRDRPRTTAPPAQRTHASAQPPPRSPASAPAAAASEPSRHLLPTKWVPTSLGPRSPRSGHIRLRRSGEIGRDGGWGATSEATPPGRTDPDEEDL